MGPYSTYLLWPQVVFFMPETNPQAHEITDSWRTKLRLKAGIMAGTTLMAALGVPTNPGPAQAAKRTAGIERVGISTNEVFTDNLQEAEDAAQKIEDLGATAVRFFYPLNKGTAWQNYRLETCNAFRAAYDHHLQPIVAFVGFDKSGRGYVPSSTTEIQQFITTAGSILWTVASNKDSQHPGGCVPEQKHFMIEGINEINNEPAFNRDVGSQTPAQAIIIDSRLSKALKKEAARPEIDATVEFGEALAVGNQDVVGFLRAEGQERVVKGLDNPYDFIDVHPYPKDPTADPSVTMTKLYGPLKQAINTGFPGTALDWGEVGTNTLDPPADIAEAYSPPVPKTLGVSETTQARYITRVLKTAASEGTSWVTFFGLQDDGIGSMPSSGEYYADGSAKDSLPAIRRQINKYQAG